jgi:hypothetical protein
VASQVASQEDSQVVLQVVLQEVMLVQEKDLKLMKLIEFSIYINTFVKNYDDFIF